MALLCLLLASACAERTYNRAALVPRATPRMTSGQPLEARGQLSLGASSVAHLGDPEVGDDVNAGVEIPGTQLFGALKGRIGEHASFGLLYENGLEKGAKKINSSQPDVEGGNVNGYGLTLDISIPIDAQWRIGVGIDAMIWSVPYVSYDLYADGTYLAIEEGSDTVETFAASITPSYKLGDDLALFGGLTVRQHPTIQQKGMEVVFDDVDVESGPANYIVSAGIEGSLANGSVLLAAVAYYDISRNPAKYGPGMGVMVSLPFGRRRAQQPSQQPPPGAIYAPPVYGPPGPQPYPPSPPAQPYPAPQPYPPSPTPQPYPPPAAPPAPAPAPPPPSQ